MNPGYLTGVTGRLHFRRTLPARQGNIEIRNLCVVHNHITDLNLLPRGMPAYREAEQAARRVISIHDFAALYDYSIQHRPAHYYPTQHRGGTTFLIFS